MESQRNSNSFIPVDPFKASIGFSIKNIWQRRREAANDAANDIYLRPRAPSKTLTLADLPYYGISAPFRFSVGRPPIPNGPSPDLHMNGQSPRLSPRKAPSLALYGPGSLPSLGIDSGADGEPEVMSSNFSIDEHYVPAPSGEHGSDHHSRSRSHSPSRSLASSCSGITTSSAVHSSNAQQPIVPCLFSSTSVRTTSNVNPAVASLRYSLSQASIHEPTSDVPPLNIESYNTTTYLLAFFLDTIPRQAYLYLLLRLPYMYFSRVTRIFEEAEMSMPQIKQGILEMAMQTKEPLAQPWILERSMENVPFKDLQNTWRAFIDSLLREWKTLNIISVLLLSAILTILQIDGASKDPLTRYAALISMICALMSLLYGCIYIIRFGTMRKSYKAAEWANEAQKTRQSIMWNIWVLLAMPATWLAWSIILFIVCIMSFVWRTGTVEDDSAVPMTRDQVLVARIIVTLVLSLGVVYLVLMIATLRRYGEMMDRAWHRRILGWVNDTFAEKLPLVSKKVIAQELPTIIPPVVPFSVPTDSPTNIRAWAANVVPETNPHSIPPYKPESIAAQTEIRSAQPKSNMIVDAMTAMSSDGLEYRSLPREAQSDQLLQHTEVEESENRLESARGIDMVQLYSIASLPNENVEIKRENNPRFNDMIWDSLPPDGWDILEEDLRLSWDAKSPARILPILDRFNQASVNTLGGQLALCQKIQSDKSKYAIFFFFYKDPLPHEQSRYELIPFDLDFLCILLPTPNVASSSLDLGTETNFMKIFLPLKRSIDTNSKRSPSS